MLSKEDWKIKAEAHKAEWREMKDRLMSEDMLDEDGYPSDAALTLIENWHWEDPDLFDFIKDIWHLASWGWNEVNAKDLPEDDPEHAKEGGILYFISTAGWSGNESIIASFEKNWMLWSLCWIESRRGGHFIFKPYALSDD